MNNNKNKEIMYNNKKIVGINKNNIKNHIYKNINLKNFKSNNNIPQNSCMKNIDIYKEIKYNLPVPPKNKINKNKNLKNSQSSGSILNKINILK